MIILNATTKSIEVLLGAAVAATQADCVASFVDLTPTTFLSGESDGVTNDTTAVTLVAAPAASTQRQIKYFTVYNRDTAPITVTVRLNNNGTFRRLLIVTLAVGSTLIYTDGEGFRVMTAAGAILGAGAGLEILSAVVVASDAAVKAAEASPITLLAPPGAGFRYIPLWVDVVADFSAGAYVADAAAFAQIHWSTGTLPQWSQYLANDAALTPARAYFDAVFEVADVHRVWLGPYADTVETSQWGNLVVPDLMSDLDNAGLQFAINNNGAGALTGGNAANTLTFTTYYLRVPVA